VIVEVVAEGGGAASAAGGGSGVAPSGAAAGSPGATPPDAPGGLTYDEALEQYVGGFGIGQLINFLLAGARVALRRAALDALHGPPLGSRRAAHGATAGAAAALTCLPRLAWGRCVRRGAPACPAMPTGRRAARHAPRRAPPQASCGCRAASSSSCSSSAWAAPPRAASGSAPTRPTPPAPRRSRGPRRPRACARSSGGSGAGRSPTTLWWQSLTSCAAVGVPGGARKETRLWSFAAAPG
jgi:hypothetical protein